MELQCFECKTVASIELDHSDFADNNDQIVLQSIEKNLPKNFMLLQVIDAVSSGLQKEVTEEIEVYED